MNSTGNPVHFLMFSWVGGLGEPAAEHLQVSEIASISGATFAVRREVWERLGGFDPVYFAYCEDVDLSLRAWQSGLRVVFEPAAQVVHHYEFARNRAKNYLLERNQLISLIVLPQARTRRLVAPAALVVEVGVLVAAARDGWADQKVAGWRWLWRHRAHLAAADARCRRFGWFPTPRSQAGCAGPWIPRRRLGPAVPALVSRGLARYWTWAEERL